jgi:hypothetical protein
MVIRAELLTEICVFGPPDLGRIIGLVGRGNPSFGGGAVSWSRFDRAAEREPAGVIGTGFELKRAPDGHSVQRLSLGKG